MGSVLINSIFSIYLEFILCDCILSNLCFCLPVGWRMNIWYPGTNPGWQNLDLLRQAFLEVLREVGTVEQTRASNF